MQVRSSRRAEASALGRSGANETVAKRTHRCSSIAAVSRKSKATAGAYLPAVNTVLGRLSAQLGEIIVARIQTTISRTVVRRSSTGKRLAQNRRAGKSGPKCESAKLRSAELRREKILRTTHSACGARLSPDPAATVRRRDD